MRYGVEADFYPLSLGKLQGGLFIGGGLASRLEDGLPNADETGLALTGGAQVQVELSTRLALTARFGVTRAHGDVTNEAMLGLSVY